MSKPRPQTVRFTSGTAKRYPIGRGWYLEVGPKRQVGLVLRWNPRDPKSSTWGYMLSPNLANSLLKSFAPGVHWTVPHPKPHCHCRGQEC